MRIHTYIHRDITCTFRDVKLYILGLEKKHIIFKIINVLIQTLTHKHTHTQTLNDVKYLYRQIQMRMNNLSDQSYI